MSRIKPVPKKTWLNDKFNDGYGKYLINRRYRIIYGWEIGTFSFKDRFTVLTTSPRFIHLCRKGSRSWDDDLFYIGEIKSIRKIVNY